MSERALNALELRALEEIGIGVSEDEAIALRNTLRVKLLSGEVQISEGPCGDLIFDCLPESVTAQLDHIESQETVH